MIVRCFAALFGVLLGLMPTVAGAEAVWVEAVGHAEIKSRQDNIPARRRALADALVNAAFAGGSQVLGHSAVTEAVVTSDYTLVRPTGQVLQHQIISAKNSQNIWQVRIKALVGPKEQMTCQGTNHLPISIYMPQVQVDYALPPWYDTVAQELTQIVRQEIDRHPAASIDQVIPYLKGHEPKSRIPAEFDYNALTRGTYTKASITGYGLEIQVKIARGPSKSKLPGVVTDVTLILHKPDGQQQIVRLQDQSEMPQTILTRSFGQNRYVLENRLRQRIEKQMRAFLTAQGCAQTQAVVKLSGPHLIVPYGTDHGLRRGSLAFVSARADDFDVLEIIELGPRYAKLRPLDPYKRPKGFANKPVYFVGGQL